MKITGWELPGSVDEPIYGATHTPDGEPAGVVLLCHGFKGYKDYGFFPQLAAACAGRGLIAHRFNFSHSGMTNRVETFERPDLFEKDTWQKQVDDLIAVADAVQHGPLDGRGLPLVCFGHSRGGVTALLTAARFPSLFAGVVTAAAPHRSCNLTDEQRDEMKRLGRLASPSGRTGQTLYVGLPWLIEQDAHPDAFDPVLAAGRITAPLLILHGDDDDTVGPVSANALHDAAPGSRFVLLPGATHTFNAPNPLPMDAQPPEQTRQLFDLVVGFAATCAQR